MEFVITYLIFVIIVSIIGNSRGRVLSGFLFSLLLSPLVGLIWVLAMPNLIKIEEEKKVNKKEKPSITVETNKEKKQSEEY